MFSLPVFPTCLGDTASVALPIPAHQRIFDRLISNVVQTVQDYQLATTTSTSATPYLLNQIHAKGLIEKILLNLFLILFDVREI
jgi:pseudouridine-5'-phosphate glycosidase